MGRHLGPSTCRLSNSATFSTGSSLVASPAWFLPDPLFLFSFHKPSCNPNTTVCMGRRIRVVSRTSPSSLRLSAVLNLHRETDWKRSILQKVLNRIVKCGILERKRAHIGSWFTAFYKQEDNRLNSNTLRTPSPQIVKTRFMDPEILICVIRVRRSPKSSKRASEAPKA